MPAAALARHRFTELHTVPVTLTLGSYTATFLGWGFIPPKRWRNEPHIHTFFEVCYAFTGAGMFHLPDQQLPIRAGEVFIARPGVAHQILARPTRPLGIYFWSYTLVSTEGAAGDPVIDGLLRDFLDSPQAISHRVPGMEATLRLLTEEVVRKEPGYQRIIRELCAKLLLDTARASVGPPRAGEPTSATALPPEQQLVERARHYIQDNLGRALSAHDISQQTGLSERHFSRIFRQVTGSSPMAYLSERRIEAAGQLLVSGVPIKEIASRLGYSDVRYFTTVFRQATGLPPANFRAHQGTRFANPAHDVR